MGTFWQYRGGHWEEVTRGVAEEVPVSLTVNGEIWVTLMCTPSDLEALAVGFLFNEGVIQGKDEIALVQVCGSGENVDVWLHRSVRRPERWRRTTGCTGGRSAVVAERARPNLPHADVRLQPQDIPRLLDALLESQVLYREIGGIHTSILSDGEQVVAAAEDVGRHNTLDKLAGRMVLEDRWPARRILVTTGRVSSEMMQKAARMGASVVISRTSPTTLSVRLAEAWGITLIGYARRGQFVVYTHSERVLHRIPSEMTAT